MECGNEERSVGSPQERSDDRDGFDGFMEDLANTLEDLAWILLIIFLIAAAVAVTIFTAGLGGVLLLVLVSVVAAGVATAAALALVLTIPETENHLFLINTTKYLNNQYIMSNGGTGYASDQKNLREWLLEHTQRVVKADFLEYNSRPYQRYSLAAIMNLADFAKDPDVRTGAQLALEYAVAKYAISSNEGRRIVPYRRKREYLFHVDGLPHDPKKWPFNGLFDLSEGADYLHALGLLYFGPSLNLPAERRQFLCGHQRVRVAGDLCGHVILAARRSHLLVGDGTRPCAARASAHSPRWLGDRFQRGQFHDHGRRRDHGHADEHDHRWT